MQRVPSLADLVSTSEREEGTERPPQDTVCIQVLPSYACILRRNNLPFQC